MDTLTHLPKDYYLNSFPTGSFTMCNPPVLNTDRDTMILVTNMSRTLDYLQNTGWERSGTDYQGDGGIWYSLKKGNENYLITEHLAYFNDFKEATDLCTELNLLDKAQRIALFHYILAEWNEEEVEVTPPELTIPTISPRHSNRQSNWERLSPDLSSTTYLATPSTCITSNTGLYHDVNPWSALTNRSQITSNREARVSQLLSRMISYV